MLDEVEPGAVPADESDDLGAVDAGDRHNAFGEQSPGLGRNVPTHWRLPASRSDGSASRGRGDRHRRTSHRIPGRSPQRRQPQGRHRQGRDVAVLGLTCENGFPQSQRPPHLPPRQGRPQNHGPGTSRRNAHRELSPSPARPSASVSCKPRGILQLGHEDRTLGELSEEPVLSRVPRVTAMIRPGVGRRWSVSRSRARRSVMSSLPALRVGGPPRPRCGSGETPRL